MQIEALDHIVLTVRSIERTLSFYTQILGMREIDFGGGRKALKFGYKKINLHLAGSEFEPKSDYPTPGSGDLCFITQTPLDIVVSELEAAGVVIEEGPAPRTGATHALMSIYCRDPDKNLIEIANTC